MGLVNGVSTARLTDVPRIPASRMLPESRHQTDGDETPARQRVATRVPTGHVATNPTRARPRTQPPARRPQTPHCADTVAYIKEIVDALPPLADE